LPHLHGGPGSPRPHLHRDGDAPLPHAHHDCACSYHLWANITVLNALRRARGLDEFSLRPHAVVSRHAACLPVRSPQSAGRAPSCAGRTLRRSACRRRASHGVRLLCRMRYACMFPLRAGRVRARRSTRCGGPARRFHQPRDRAAQQHRAAIPVSHVCTGTALAPPASAPAHPCHICA
jgi:hypothetical protein